MEDNLARVREIISCVERKEKRLLNLRKKLVLDLPSHKLIPLYCIGLLKSQLLPLCEIKLKVNMLSEKLYIYI